VSARATVLIVDDHDSFRRAASELLEAGGFSVVGGAGSGEEALRIAATLRPDIVLIDIQLDDNQGSDGLDGIDVAERLATSGDGPAVVLVSSRDASAYGARLAAAPARGFIPKRRLSGEALAALVK
jgi:two-component system, NarL family, nitrate/nitrite response regulator NarL